MITKTQTILAITALLVIFSCNTNQEQSIISLGVKVVEAHGYIVPNDSMTAPKVIPAGKPKVVRAGKPRVVLTHTKVHPAGIPRVVKAGIPKVCTPGQDSFSLPKTVPAIDSPFMAGIPEVVIAKEAYIKDQNPQNFSFFGKLQGLKNAYISCILEDKNGNLWFGTWGGVSKYDGKSFTLLTQKEGLGSNAVSSIVEDKSGNLWFGKINTGVSKYDGKNFTSFTVKEGLSNDRVLSMHKDKSSNLWFGTKGGGVNKYDGKSFTHFTEKEGLSNNNVYSIVEDKSGNFWFGTDSGVSKYNGKSFENFTQKEGLSNDTVYSILEDKRGNLWFGTGGGGVSKYDGESFSNFTDKEGLSDNSVMSIREAKSGNLWFGTGGGGVSKYDGKSFENFTDKEGLSDNSVRSILEDKSSNLWFGTYRGGVCKYGGKSFTHFTVKEGLSDNSVRSILEDKSGNLWFGTEGDGVNKYDGKSFTHFTRKEGLSSDAVLSMLKDKSGNLWFGTYGGGINKYDGKSFTHFTEKEGLCDNSVLSILEDKNGNLWFGAIDGVSKYDGKSFTNFTGMDRFINDVNWRLVEDRSGNLWFGLGGGGGVIKYDGKRLTRFTEREGLSNNFVRDILEDKSGNLWFATLGGVSKYDGKSFAHFTEKEGLNNNDVWSIIEDKNGDLWFGTTVGLNKLEKDKLASFTKIRRDKATPNLYDSALLFKTYTYEDGFLGIGINPGKTIYEAKDGTIWIGASDRLTAFHPREETPDTIAPNIQLTGLTLYNENIAWQNLLSHRARDGRTSGIKDTSIILGNGVKVHDLYFNEVSRWYGVPEHLSLAYNNNYLTFQFVGITMRSPKKVKYKFKLEGLENNWSALTNRSEASYGNLPPGKYTFKVKAMNSEGYWSKEFNYSFIIRPPWWQTWWASTLYVLVFVVALAIFIKWRERTLRKEKALLEEKVTLRTQELQKEKEKVESTLVQVKELQAQLVETEKMNERLRISRELHDDIGSTLGSISIYSEVAKKRTEKNEDPDEVLSKIGVASRELIDRMSDIVWSLNPNNESFEQLQNRMMTFAAMILTPRNILYDFIADEELKKWQLTDEQRKNIFLIFKEALYNIVKYADCKRADITLTAQKNSLIMKIQDDGKGFDVSEATANKVLSAGEYLGGNGIKNMNARAEDINATLCIKSEKNEGTTVQLKLHL
jgi:ligand-binding sensor domain-containing protein/signal transduction histidine kinase